MLYFIPEKTAQALESGEIILDKEVAYRATIAARILEDGTTGPLQVPGIMVNRERAVTLKSIGKIREIREF